MDGCTRTGLGWTRKAPLGRNGWKRVTRRGGGDGWGGYTEKTSTDASLFREYTNITLKIVVAVCIAKAYLQSVQYSTCIISMKTFGVTNINVWLLIDWLSNQDTGRSAPANPVLDGNMHVGGILTRFRPQYLPLLPEEWENCEASVEQGFHRYIISNFRI